MSWIHSFIITVVISKYCSLFEEDPVTQFINDFPKYLKSPQELNAWLEITGVKLAQET